ncbi:MAG: hypothetical protein ACTSR8_21015 [Promethearchaeota archaeon]
MKLPKDLQKKKSKKSSTPSKPNVEEIKAEFPVNEVIDFNVNKPIPCPKCSKVDLLRSWEINSEEYALCYFCGAIFPLESGEILHVCKGDRIGWGATALAIIGSKSANK